MKKGILFILVVVALTETVLSQHHVDEHEHSHEHSHVHEIGISVSPIYFFNAEELSIASHIHYVYNFPHSKFGLGLGHEIVFDEHSHRFWGLELNYRPVHALTFNLSPGVVYEKEHPDERNFAIHFETVYEFEFGAFHIGPVVEIAWHPEDYHASIGLHIGLGL